MCVVRRRSSQHRRRPLRRRGRTGSTLAIATRDRLYRSARSRFRTRAPLARRATLDAPGCARLRRLAERGFPLRVSLFPSTASASASTPKRATWFQKRTFTRFTFERNRPRSNAKLRCRVAEARNLVKRTNARFVRVDRRDPRAAHEARAARTRPPVLFVSITGTFSGSPGERYVPPPPMRPIEPPIPVRRLPSLPRCASGEIDPVSCSRSRRDRVADPAGRAPRRSAHAALVQRRDLFRPTEDAHREALTSSPQRAFPASSRTT